MNIDDGQPTNDRPQRPFHTFCENFKWP